MALSVVNGKDNANASCLSMENVPNVYVDRSVVTIKEEVLSDSSGGTVTEMVVDEQSASQLPVPLGTPRHAVSSDDLVRKIHETYSLIYGKDFQVGAGMSENEPSDDESSELVLPLTNGQGFGKQSLDDRYEIVTLPRGTRAKKRCVTPSVVNADDEYLDDSYWRVIPPSKPTSSNLVKKEPRPKGLLCHHCGLFLASRRSLSMHVLIHDPERVGAAWKCCKVCGKSFDSEEERQRHHDEKHDLNSKTLPCKYCDPDAPMMFKTKNALFKHVARDHKEWKFVCSHCGKKFLTKNKMQLHIGSIHGGPKDHYCPICSKGYSQRSALTYHMRSHADVTAPFTCGYCGSTYTYKYTMVNHVKAKHGNDNTEVKCCGMCLTGYDEVDLDNHECIAVE